MLLHFLTFECKTEENEFMRQLLMKNSAGRIMDVHVSPRCTWYIVVISFKSYWFSETIHWWSADYPCGLIIVLDITVFVFQRRSEVSSALLWCPPGCNPAGHDLLAAGAAAEEVGVLQQPGCSQKGQPDLPHTQWLLQRSCCQRQPWYVGNLSESRRHGSLQCQFVNTRGREQSWESFLTSVHVNFAYATII